MRLTVRTNIAMRALMTCAVNPDKIVRKAEIAEATGASEAHLGVVINQLAQTGFIETIRGRHGGIRLKLAPELISVGRVFRTFEANTPFTECFSARDNHCPIAPVCKLRTSIDDALDAFYSSLDKVTLADLTCDNAGLVRLLAVEPATC